MDKYRELVRENLRKILIINAESFKSPKFTYLGYEREREFRMCNINGKRLICLSDIGSGFSARLPVLYDMGLLDRRDVYYFRNGRQVSGFADVEKLSRNINLILPRINDIDERSLFITVIQAAYQKEVPETRIDPMWLAASNKAAEERRKAIRDGIRYRKGELQEPEPEKEQGDDLMDLVKRIENLGWKVTLTLKENG